MYGIFVIVPTYATPNANSSRASNIFDEETFTALLDKLIRDGVNGIITTGSMGEAHTLLWDEHNKLIEVAVNVAKGRVPVIMGTTSLNTRRAIEKKKFAAEAGADGVMNSSLCTYHYP